MELKKAYTIFLKRLEKDSLIYQSINGSEDCSFLSTLYFLKCYKNYILYYTNTNKEPRISKLDKLSRKEETLLGNLLESSTIFIDVLGLNPENILKESKEMEDPLNVIDLVLDDYLNTVLSDDDMYENIILSLFNVLIKNNFEIVLRNLFLKYAHIKKWK